MYYQVLQFRLIEAFSSVTKAKHAMYNRGKTDNKWPVLYINTVLKSYKQPVHEETISERGLILVCRVKKYSIKLKNYGYVSFSVSMATNKRYLARLRH